MAVIQTIRNRAGMLVAIIIGMALVAFILGDMFSSGSQMMSRSKANVAVVNGSNVSIDYFQGLINEQEELAKMQSGRTALDEQTQLQIRQSAWDDMIRTMVLEREFDKIGLGVSSEELFDLINGDNPHPYIMQFFADPNTGVINRLALAQFLQNVNTLDQTNEQKRFWLYLEDLIYKERKSAKYNTLVRQGLYATSLEAQRRNAEMNTSVDFSYVLKRYGQTPDSTVAVTEADVKEYYKNHKNEFKQSSSRDIRYVVWEVVPSDKDIKAAEAWIKEVKPEFEGLAPEGTEQYIRANSDIQPLLRNYTKGELDADIDAFAFEANEGDVYGPYFEDNHYKLAKLAKISFLPDSVRASHILFQVDQSNVAQVRVLADSLLEEIKNGADFAALARVHSQDQSNSPVGGDLGWFKEGVMTQPFNDTCFQSKKGDVKMVFTQFGIHIVKVTGQSRAVKKVQVGVVARQVRASEETDQTYFAQASEFGSVNNTKAKFDKAISEGNVRVLSAQGLTTNNNEVSGLESSRSLVKWAFNNDAGSVTERVMEFGNKYVVAVLDNVREEGFASLESVRSEIEFEVRKQKQAEQLAAKLNDAAASGDLNAIAASVNENTQVATNVRFTSYSIPNLGNEPKVQAAAIALEEGAVSPAIEGTNGVYVIKVDAKNVNEQTDNSFAKSMLNRTYSTRANSSILVLNELANIEDNRIVFY